MPTLATMLTPTGTPSSGLDSQAWQESIPFRRSNNSPLFRSLPPPSLHPKPSSCETGRTPMTFSIATLITGSLLFTPTATHPLSTWAPFHALIAERPPLQSNSPSTTHLLPHTQTSSDHMQATTLSVWSTTITSCHHHQSQNNNALIASCVISMIPAPIDHLPSLPPPLLHEHHSHDLSSLAQEAFDSGLVRVALSGGT